MRLIVLIIICIGFCGHLSAQVGRVETGIASFYHDKFVGRKTANGEIFRQDKFTAAHKSLPLGTWVRVTNLSNDSTVVVRINDRMPQSNKRAIDLTERAAEQLNFIPKGLTKVRIEVIPAPPLIPEPRDLPVVAVATHEPAHLKLHDTSISIKTISYPVDWQAYDRHHKTKKKKKR